MRFLLLILLLVALIGCQAPPKLESDIVAELSTAIQVSCIAMGVEVPAQRSLHDQAGLLAIQSPIERQNAIRAGDLRVGEVVGEAREALFELDRRREGLQPPRLLVWLVENVDSLDRGQILLLDALTHQTNREARLKDAKKP